MLPECQGLGLGKALKWAQRDEALKRGIDLLTWTYDPMQARNANLNLHVLGVVGRTYLRNFYGETPTLGLDDGVPERPVSRRVVDQIAPGAGPGEGDRACPRTPERSRRPRPGDGRSRAGGGSGTSRTCGSRRPASSSRSRRNSRICPQGTGLIAAWQTAARRAFEAYFKRGYRLDDFISGERCFYVLKHAARR